MKTIRIGFSTPKHKFLPVFSWAIKLIGRTPYSHVYVRWQTDYGPSICYHAAGHSLHFLSAYMFNRTINMIEEFEITLSDSRYRSMMIYCLENAGKSYGLLEVMAIAIRKITGINLKFLRSGDKKQYCAELVYRIIGIVKEQECPTDPDQIDMKQIYGIVKLMASKEVPGSG